MPPTVPHNNQIDTLLKEINDRIQRRIKEDENRTKYYTGILSSYDQSSLSNTNESVHNVSNPTLDTTVQIMGEMGTVPAYIIGPMVLVGMNVIFIYFWEYLLFSFLYFYVQVFFVT
jgi:hypothetical protein